MEAPSARCKAKDCIKSRVNENFCGVHTHKLHPLYKRYKKLEAELGKNSSGFDLSTISTQNIPTLVKLYGQYAKVYATRRKYRNAIDPLFHDWGHANAIDLVWNSMCAIEERLHELTSKSDSTSLPMASQNPPEDESESNLEDLTPDAVIRTHTNYEMWDHRQDCFYCVITLQKEKYDRLFKALEIVVRNNIPSAIPAGISTDRLPSIIDLLSKYSHSILFLLMATLAFGEESAVENKNFDGKMISSNQITLYKMYEYTRAIRAIVEYKGLLTMICAVSIYVLSGPPKRANEIVRRTHVREGKVWFYMSPRGHFIAEEGIPVPIEFLLPPPRSPRMLFCLACAMELMLHKPYGTLKGHVFEVPKEELQRDFEAAILNQPNPDSVLGCRYLEKDPP